MLAPNICYESIFSGILRNNVKLGADVLINITNDGWFLKTGAPEQHFNANILRAVENGRPVVRAANTGISGAIDPWGGLLLKTPLLTSGQFETTIPVSNLATFYTRWGNWFTWVCWFILAGGLGYKKTIQILSSLPKKRRA